MARKKNIHENYSQVLFKFLNSSAPEMYIKSTVSNKEKIVAKSINNHRAWQKEQKQETVQSNIPKRFNVDLM